MHRVADNAAGVFLWNSCVAGLAVAPARLPKWYACCSTAVRHAHACGCVRAASLCQRYGGASEYRVCSACVRSRAATISSHQRETWLGRQAAALASRLALAAMRQTPCTWQAIAALLAYAGRRAWKPAAAACIYKARPGAHGRWVAEKGRRAAHYCVATGAICHTGLTKQRPCTICLHLSIELRAGITTCHRLALEGCVCESPICLTGH